MLSKVCFLLLLLLLLLFSSLGGSRGVRIFSFPRVSIDDEDRSTDFVHRFNYASLFNQPAQFTIIIVFRDLETSLMVKRSLALSANDERQRDVYSRA